MARVLIVSDAPTLRDEVRSVFNEAEDELVEIARGEEVRNIAEADPPDLVIADSQIQNMGGIAICMDIKLEESGGRLPSVPVLLLLDRRADVFIAKRSGAEGFVVKPLDPIRLRKAIDLLLRGEPYHDPSYAPITVPATR